jgi:restriction system protein
MARRKDDNLVEMFSGLFMHIPPWTCIPIAMVAGGVVGALVLTVSAANPLLKGFAGIAWFAGWGIALLILFSGFKATMERWFRRKTLAKQTGIESIRALNWSDFELLVGEAYRQQGYEVEEVGGGGADGGIDLKLHRDRGTTIVQCKQWKAWKVGVKPIREFYGVLISERAEKGIFVTSGVFTGEARAFAAGKPLELIDGSALTQLVRPSESSAGSETVALHSNDDETKPSPECPRCNGTMKLRTARKGTAAGSQFWGCGAYPACKGTRELQSVASV